MKEYLLASGWYGYDTRMSCRSERRRARNLIVGRRTQPGSQAVGRPATALQRAADASAQVGRLGALQRVADKSVQSTMRSGPVLQAYRISPPNSDGKVARVSGSWKSAVLQDSGKGGKDLFATPDIIKDGDDKLLAASSAIGLRQSGDSFEYGAHTVAYAVPYLREQAVTDADPEQTKKIKGINAGTLADNAGVTDSDLLALWTDCGRAARTVMGVEGTGEAPKAKTAIGDSKASSNPKDYSDDLYPKAIKAFFGSDAKEGFMKRGVHYYWLPHKLFGKTVFITPRSADHARRMYMALSEEGRAAFDKHVGINRFANPDIGDAYTMVTESKMPGYTANGFTWNFHWAGVVAKDGDENITLEGYAVDMSKAIQKARKDLKGNARKKEIARLRKYGSEYIDRDWTFQMYGQDEGQTFHDEHLESGTHGNRATTFHAKA
ncbi:hypothetical protein [Roseobacter weihaiensis]|uniref:hypothetical protein n=1 Tax=Roseobacter weihaiensis TaxID=2763262 RepID=UPI001D0A778B|nr:hypothetical protein [Roseobacter sp. H9]